MVLMNERGRVHCVAVLATRAQGHRAMIRVPRFTANGVGEVFEIRLSFVNSSRSHLVAGHAQRGRVLESQPVSPTS